MDALYRPVAGKPFVLEDLSLGMGTSVASALSAETVFEIIKCRYARTRAHGVKSRNFHVFFNSAYAHDRNMSIFRRRASTVTENTLIKPKCASVRQSTD